jgi:hypothetical protein
MADTLHIPTLIRWLKELSAIKEPSNYQLTEAWCVAQTLHTIRYPADQIKLDDCRRAIMSHLSRTENEWNKPKHERGYEQHLIVPSTRKIRSWTEIELTPELSWSTLLAGATVPTRLVKRLRGLHGRQLTNIKELLTNSFE